MRLIDADDILQDLADLMKSPWANPCGDDALMTVRRLTIKEALDAVRELVIEHAPTVEPEPARLLTVEDWTVGNNPDIDSDGCLPCWAEYANNPNGSGWYYCCFSDVDKTDEDYDPKARYWTKRPTKEQMANTPWEDGA